MQTSLHIMALVKQLRRELMGAKIVDTAFYKKERAVHLFAKNPKTRMALIFIYHPTGHGTFLVPASKIDVRTREKPWPVFNLDGAVISDVEQFAFDRIFTSVSYTHLTLPTN